MTAIHLCARYGHVNILDALDGHVNWRITSKKVKINEDFDELCKRKCQRIRRKKTCVFCACFRPASVLFTALHITDK